MIKQVILVPMWLGMSPGKVAAQCCHVTAMVLEDLYPKWQPDCRIILRVETKKEMAILWQKMDKSEVVFGWRFKDRAPTTEGTAGKFTAYSFLGRAEDVDQLTGHLELY